MYLYLSVNHTVHIRLYQGHTFTYVRNDILHDNIVHRDLHENV